MADLDIIDADTIASLTAPIFPYFFAWKNNPKRKTLYRKHCRVLARGPMNSCCVEFESGHREIISRNALRRRA